MEQVHCTDVVTALVSNFACDKIPTRNDTVTLITLNTMSSWAVVNQETKRNETK